MRKLALIIFSIVSSTLLSAQISVFDCNTYSTHLTQAKIDLDSNFYGNCFELGGNDAVIVQNNTYKRIKATEKIHLKPGVHLGGFTNTGQTHLLIADSSNFDVVVMNYDDLHNVLRYKKLELGIPLPQDIQDRIMMFVNKEGAENHRLNPFVDWDLDVSATFYHPASGSYESVNGFYTREYEQNSATSDWDDIGTDYPFRVRYAPPQNGEWNAYVTIKVKGQPATESLMFKFNVIESGDPGYVKVHQNKRNLQRGDRMIFPIGQNFVGPYGKNLAWGGTRKDNIQIDSTHYLDTITGEVTFYGHNLFSNTNTEKTANIVAWNDYLEMLEQYLQTEDNGGSKYFRTIQTPYSSLIEFEEKGNYYKRLHYAAETDKILDLCEEYDALFQFNFMIQEPMMMYANYDMWFWDWDNYLTSGTTLPHYNSSFYDLPVYCYNDDPSYTKQDGSLHIGSKKPHEMFTNESDLAYHKQRTRYYIARYGYSTKIYEFEILSEPFHLSEFWHGENKAPYEDDAHQEHTLVRDAVYNYHKVISEYIKDSLKHTKKQLIGIDISWEDKGSGKPIRGVDQSILLSSIDIIGFNKYYSDPKSLIITDDNSVFNFADTLNDFRKDDGKVSVPVIIPEGGTDEGFTACSGFSQHPVDKMTLPFSGIAGYNAWGGYDPLYSDENGVVTMPDHIYDMWKTTIRAKNHMNGNDVIGTLSEGSGAWTHGLGKANKNGKLKKYSIDHQYYTSSNKYFAVGYVRNLTYNVKTRGPFGSDCYNQDFEQVNNSPRNIKWNQVGVTKRLRVDFLIKREEYRIHWYSAFREADNGYLKSDCIKTNKKDGKWGITLEFPELTVSHNGNNDLPVVWYVLYKENCNSGMAQQNNLDKNLISLEELQSLENNNQILKALNVYPNPFQNYISIQSPQEDQMILQTIEGKKIAVYKIEKGETNVNTFYLNNGMYILTFINQIQTFKLIKQ